VEGNRCCKTGKYHGDIGRTIQDLWKLMGSVVGFCWAWNRIKISIHAAITPLGI